MAKLRVLIVDDSVVIRRIVTQVLSDDPTIEVAGTAANGRIALTKIPQLNPDLVTLDVEMPEMDGLETLREIRKLYPRLPVVMFSTLTERGAATTLEALSAGASDYVTKPANAGGLTEGIARIREQLVPKIKSLCERAAARAISVTATTTATTPAIAGPRPAATARASAGPVEVVAIGVSTGGPNALAQVLPQLPGGLPAAVLVTQHMPPVFTKMLADRLATRCAMPVREAVAGELVKPGEVLFAPGGFHLTVERLPRVDVASGATCRVVLSQEPPENSCRPAVDVMFRSIAQAYGGSRTLAVILTGMGSDGLKGCERLRQGGASVLVQDEATSVVWGMPGFVARANLADRVLPLADVAGEIARRVRAGRTPLSMAG